jgi:putative ABC transport system permease protein
MSLIFRIRSLWRNLVHRERVERDVESELHSYVDLLSDEYRSNGRSNGDAVREARVQLGGVQQVKEGVLAAKAGAWLETLWHDVRFGARLLWRTPSFAAAAIVSLALGIGANTAVFGLVNAIRLRTLPVERAQELAEIRLEGPRCCRHTGRNRQVSLPLWQEISGHQQAFSEMFAFADTRFNLAPRGEVRYVEGLFVSGDFFRVLGVKPALGRTLTPLDDRAGCTNSGAVISHALWQSEFGGRDDVLGRTLDMPASQHPIVGVMPASFFGVEVGRRFEVAMPMCASGFGRPDHWWLAVMGRLKPGWTASQATAHLATLGPSLLQAVVPPSYGADQAKQFVTLRLNVVPAANGISPLRTEYEEPLWLLLAIAGLVLVTACANVASLSLVRTTARENELALRLALGASKVRIVRQFLVEGLLIASAGTVAGIVLARIAHDAVVVLLSTPTDRVVLETAPDWRILGFTIVVIGATTMVFALAPAARIWRDRSLTATEVRVTHAPRRVVAREVLVAIQVAMSVVLVSSAMLFIMTSKNLLATEAGFNAPNLLIANVFLSDSDYPADTRAAARRELTARFEAIPGVVGVTHAVAPPLGGSSWDTVVRIASPDGERKGETNRNEVGTTYFRVMETALVAGRDFSTTDTPSSPKVAIVNETFVRRFFGKDQALGRTFAEGEQKFEIVGIVRDSKFYTMREEFRPIAYTPASQASNVTTTMRFVLRSGIAMAQTRKDVRRTLAEFSPGAGLRFATLEDLAAASAQRERLMARLAGFFGAIALVLAAVGVYGVVAYSAASRRREIGIRLALGARAADIVRTMIGRIAVVAACGLVVGLALTLSTRALAESFLYGVRLEDPGVLALILGVIAAAGVLAAIVPTRRALQTDPVQALRSE